MRFVLKTWNCFGSAQSAVSLLRGQAPDTHRFSMSEIVDEVHGADVLCIQELFIDDAETFFDRLTHSHKTRDDNAKTLWPLTFGGSGLGIASRFPFAQRSLRPFQRPHSGVERFARKGMMHATVRLPGSTPREIDVFTTHFQSGSNVEAIRVRERQLNELRAFVDSVACDDRPIVICGDLNIDGLSAAREKEEYRRMRDTFPEFTDLGADADHPTFHPDPAVNELAHRYWPEPPQRIDYVLFRRAADDFLGVGECALALHAPYVVPQRGKTFASDHFALKVVFEVG